MVKVLDFYADWCGCSRMMNPVICELVKELKDRVVFEKINLDKDPNLAEEFGVLSIPTYIIQVDGRQVQRIVGMVPKETLAAKILAQFP